MDRLIYLTMSGASHTLSQQATTAQNLANVATTGYRSETNVFRAVPVSGDGLPTRAFVVDSTVGANFTPGAIQHTGRDLDLAVQGPGWIAVQLADGSEAYTRNGSLQISTNGVLQTRNGLNVLGDGGPISIPPDSDITIAKDGTVSVVPNGQKRDTVMTVGRIKLVNPPEAQLVHGADGLFRLRRRRRSAGRCQRVADERCAGRQQRQCGGGDGEHDSARASVRYADEDAAVRREQFEQGEPDYESKRVRREGNPALLRPQQSDRFLRSEA